VKASGLKAMFGGPRNSKGEQLYSDWPIDAGIGTGNWRAWKIESPVAAWNNYPIISVMGAASLAMIFTTPPTKIGGSNAELVDFLAKFDFDRDAPKIYRTAGKFTQSAMDFMTPPDVADPKLEGLHQASRKMITAKPIRCSRSTTQLPGTRSSMRTRAGKPTPMCGCSPFLA
jgi:hypothetical protein